MVDGAHRSCHCDVLTAQTKRTVNLYSNQGGSLQKTNQTMKKLLFTGAMALLSVIALAFTSCSNDDDDLLQSNIEFKNVEFGHKNSKTGTIGDDLHLECDIKSGSKIQSVEVVLSKDG